jgi:N-acetylneuraminic acid mutarotase
MAKNIAAIGILIVKSPFLLLGYLFKNKILLLVLIAIAGIIFFQTTIKNKQALQVQIPVYQQQAPTYAQAPRALPTSSRLYYVSTYKDTGEVLILTQYYYYDSNKKGWQMSNTPLPLDKELYGDLKIYERR